MFALMSKCFLAAIKPSLSEMEAWNDEIASAWESLFELITAGMRRGFIATEAATTLASEAACSGSSSVGKPADSTKMIGHLCSNPIAVDPEEKE